MERLATGPTYPHTMGWLLHTTNRMVGCRSLTTLLDLAYDAIRDGLGYDRVGLELVDTTRQTLICHVGTDARGDRYHPIDDALPIDAAAFFARVLDDQRMQADGPGFVFLADAAAILAPADWAWLDGRPAQILLVALRAAERVLGFISVDNLISGRPITADASAPLVAFANALAAAIENVSLLESRARRISDLDADLRRRVDHLTWLRDASARLATLQDLDQVLDAIYTGVRQQVDRVGLFLIAPNARGRPVARKVYGTDARGKRTGSYREAKPLDAEGLRERSPDLFHLMQGHSFYYCPDRWAITPETYRHRLNGRMGEQLVIALRHDGEMVGFLSLDNLLTGRSLSPDDAPPLVAFAAQAALAISRARLWAAHEAQSRRLVQRVAELEWLREISGRINGARSLAAVLEALFTGIRWGLGFDHVSVWLCDEHETILHEHQDAATDSRVLPLGALDGSRGGMALLRGEVSSTLIDALTSPFGAPSTTPGPEDDHMLVALRSSRTLEGVLVISNPNSHRLIAGDEARPLIALSSQVSTAIRNLRLQDRERAEHARLALLLESAHALNSSLNRDEILHTLAARLVDALDAAGAAFCYADSRARTYSLMVEHVAPGQPSFLPSDPATIFDTYPVLEEVLRSGVPFRAHLDDPDCPDSERALLKDHGMQAELVVPVIVRGTPIGLLEIYWTRRVAIADDTVGLCVAIAEQAAVALANAQLYADAAARAERDALTGMLNHSALLEQIDRQVAAGMPFALVLVDINDFKLFNDTYGHPTGDAVLTWVAGILRATCREGDIAGRYGGDEMALVLRNTSARGAQVIADRLEEAVQARPHVTVGGAVIPISLSAGVACYPDDGRTRQELVAVADAAMYEMKRRGTLTRATAGGRLIVPTRPETRPPRNAIPADDHPYSVLMGLVAAVDIRDRYTKEHSDHVAHLAQLLAEALDLRDGAREVLTMAGALHDIGKIAVPDYILRKPGPLTAEEYTIVQQHVPYGVAILRGMLDGAAVIEAVACHHERWDGTGYPRGLAGANVPLTGRILQVADAVSSMLLDRPYRHGMTWPEVVRQLKAGAGGQFDPDLIEPFLAACTRYHGTAIQAAV